MTPSSSSSTSSVPTAAPRTFAAAGFRTDLQAAAGVTPAEPVSIDGASGVVTTYLVAPSGGAGQETVAMVVNRAGNTYEVALVTAQAGGPDGTALQEILNSWAWA